MAERLRGDLQKGAALEGEMACQKVGNQGGEVVLAGSGEEAQMAKIDAQNRREKVGAGGVDELHGGEEGAVAADGEEVVETINTVAIADGLRRDAGALQLGAEVVERCLVGRVDVAVVEGYLHTGWVF